MTLCYNGATFACCWVSYDVYIITLGNSHVVGGVFLQQTLTVFYNNLFKTATRYIRLLFDANFMNLFASQCQQVKLQVNI